MPLFNTCMLLNLSNLHTAVLILSTKKIRVVVPYEYLNLGILNKYTPISVKVALGFGH